MLETMWNTISIIIFLLEILRNSGKIKIKSRNELIVGRVWLTSE